VGSQLNLNHFLVSGAHFSDAPSKVCWGNIHLPEENGLAMILMMHSGFANSSSSSSVLYMT